MATPRHRATVNAVRLVPFVTTLLKGTSPASSSVTYNVGEDSAFMDDWVVPNFHALREAGYVFNNPCLYERVNQYLEGTGFAHYKQNTGQTEYTHSGCLTWFRGFYSSSNYKPGVFPLEESINASHACQQALAKIDPTPYAFGEDLLEVGETLRYLRNPLAGLGRVSDVYRKAVYERSLKRTRSGRPIGLAKAHADVWLEHRFAMTPLIRSVVDIQQAYNLKPKTPPERLSARGFDREDRKATRVVSKSYNGVTMQYDQSAALDVDIHASIMYQVRNPVYDERWRFGLRAKDIPTTFWQIMPLSFMVDRVADISSFIKGVMNVTDPGIEMLAASIRKKRTLSNRTKLTSHTYTGWTAAVSGETVCRNDFQYSRNPWYPTIRDAIPAIRPKNLVSDATKCLDLASLIVANVRPTNQR